MATSLTPVNRTPLVHILTWFFFFVSLFFLAVRHFTRRALSNPFKIEDGLIIAAAIISLAQSIAVSLAAANGIGRLLQSLRESQIQTALKSEYAATVLLIVCLGAAKLSAVVFSKGLSPDVRHQQYSYILAASVIVWTIIGTFTSLFPCWPPQTWNYLHGKHCFDLSSWWTFVAVTNMFTEIPIVALQTLLLWGLQVSNRSKFLLLSIFSSRLLIVGAAIAQVISYRSSIESPDFTLSAWLPAILNQVVQLLAITTTCIPHAKRFLESLESGMIRVGEPEEERGGTELQTTGNSARSGRSRKLNTI